MNKVLRDLLRAVKSGLVYSSSSLVSSRPLRAAERDVTCHVIGKTRLVLVRLLLGPKPQKAARFAR